MYVYVSNIAEYAIRGSVTACMAIDKLIQCGRIGLGLPLHVCRDISEIDVCITNTLYMLHR